MDREASFWFLRECLSSITIGRQPTTRLAGDFRWANFIALAHEYRVSGTVSAVLADSSVLLPCPAKALFTNLAAHARQRNAQILQQAVEVAKVLNGIGVDPLFMKGGAHLFTKLYPDMAMRQTADLDILVPVARIDDCVAALNAIGISALTDYLHPRSHHGPPLGRSDLPVPIELHHHVLAYPNWNFLTAEEMRASSVQRVSPGVRLALPSPTYAAIHNIAHAQLNDHDYLYGRIDLRALLDLALLSKVHAGRIDWDAIHRRFVDAKRRHAFEYHIEMARELGADVPSIRSVRKISRLLCRRAAYQVRNPQSLSLSFRLLRPFVLLRRELADSTLRRRLAENLCKVSWWKRHLSMLATNTIERPIGPKSRALVRRLRLTRKTGRGQ
jgi:hypothetical protein